MTRETWSLDPERTEIGFVARHMVITKVRGRFHKWSAQIERDTGDITTSKVSARIDVASVDTKDKSRDDNLRSELFQIDKHPSIDFVSTRIEKKGKDRYVVHGDLAMHGKTRSIALEVEGRDTRFTAKGRINRRDWDLAWSAALEAGSVLVGDQIDISIDVWLVR